MRLKKYVDEISKMRERGEDGEYDILSILRSYMPPELERFTFYTYPRAWLEAFGTGSSGLKEKYLSEDLSYMKPFMELERVDWYRAETEDTDREDESYDGYARSGSVALPGTHTLYIRALEIDGETKYYIGITKNSSLERLESDRYYQHNKRFHADIISAVEQKVNGLPCSATERSLLWSSIEAYLNGIPISDIKLDMRLDLGKGEERYTDVKKILADIGIPETVDVSATLPGWMASFLERLHIDAFSLDTDKKYGYNNKMGGDHLEAWPIIITKLNENGEPLKDADGNIEKDVFSDLEEAAKYIPALNALGNIKRHSLYGINGIQTKIREHNERAMRIWQGEMTTKDLDEYKTASSDERAQMRTMINISVDLFVPENEPTYHLLTRFFYEGHDRYNAYPLCVMRNGYFVATRYGLGTTKKEYSERYGLSAAEVDRRIRNGDILHGDKRVCLASDLPYLRIPEEMDPASWRSFSRSQTPPGCNVSNIYIDEHPTGNGKNTKKVSTYIWEEEGRTYWYCDAPGVLMDLKTLASLRGVNDMSTEGICMMRGSDEILYDLLCTFAHPQYIDGVCVEGPFADMER